MSRGGDNDNPLDFSHTSEWQNEHAESNNPGNNRPPKPTKKARTRGKHEDKNKRVVEGNINKPEPKIGKHMTDARKTEVTEEINDQRYGGNLRNMATSKPSPILGPPDRGSDPARRPATGAYEKAAAYKANADAEELRLDRADEAAGYAGLDSPTAHARHARSEVTTRGGMYDEKVKMPYKAVESKDPWQDPVATPRHAKETKVKYF